MTTSIRPNELHIATQGRNHAQAEKEARILAEQYFDSTDFEIIHNYSSEEEVVQHRQNDGTVSTTVLTFQAHWTVRPSTVESSS